MNKISYYILVLILFISLSSCGEINENEISNYYWKYGSGYHIGDFTTFNKKNLKKRTIYSNKKPIAIITFCGKPFYRDDYVLEIKSLKTGEKGTYHEKGLIKL